MYPPSGAWQNIMQKTSSFSIFAINKNEMKNQVRKYKRTLQFSNSRGKAEKTIEICGQEKILNVFVVHCTPPRAE